jgi:hypothetical protein
VSTTPLWVPLVVAGVAGTMIAGIGGTLIAQRWANQRDDKTRVLRWAFGRSLGERSLACALLACFWDSGLFLPWYGIRRLHAFRGALF